MTKMMTRQEAADVLCISVATIDRLRKSGQLGYIQRTANGKVWISMDAVEAYIARITHPAMPEQENRQTYRKRRV